MTEPVVHDVLDLTDPHVVVGAHSVWSPKLGIKVPFQWAGAIQKYQRPEEATYPVETLMEEVGFLRLLASLGWAPTIGRIVYFKTVISEHRGYWWADPLGAYGYEMTDAATMPEPGYFDYGAFTRWAPGYITASPGALNDINKPGNVINGYLVDVRRSWFDRLKWHGDVDPLPRYTEPFSALVGRLAIEGQFPFKERVFAYQDYYLNDAWYRGEREVVPRADLMQFEPGKAESVLDIGCHTGGFLQYAWLRDAGPLVGLDVQPEYIDLARDLARASGMNICYRLGNLEEEFHTLVPWLSEVMWDGIDHLLLLSMLKHFKGGETFLWNLIDGLWAKQTYLETNAVKEGQYPLKTGVEARGGTLRGTSEDRNPRRVYKIVRP